MIITMLSSFGENKAVAMFTSLLVCCCMGGVGLANNSSGVLCLLLLLFMMFLIMSFLGSASGLVVRRLSKHFVGVGSSGKDNQSRTVDRTLLRFAGSSIVDVLFKRK